MSTFRVTGVLAGDGSGWANTLRQGETAARRFGTTVRSAIGGQLAAAFSIGAIAMLTRKTIQLGSSLRDMSSRLGINVEWLQATGYAAEQAGSSMEGLQKFLGQVARARNDALGGGETGKRKLGAFAMFGISEADLKANNLQKIFDAIGKAFKAGNQQTLIPAMMEVGGRGGAEMVQAFVQGLDASRQEAYDTGLIMSETTVDSLKRISDQFTLLGRMLMTEFAPAILATANAIMWARSKIGVAGTAWGTAHERAVQGSKSDARAGIGFWGRFKNVFKRLWGGMGEGQISGEADMQDAMDKLEIAYEAMRKSRAANEAAAGGATPFYTMGSGRGGGSKTKAYTDSLLSVGNFLGAGRNAVARVQEQQLDVQREMARTLKEIKTNTDDVGEDGF